MMVKVLGEAFSIKERKTQGRRFTKLKGYFRYKVILTSIYNLGQMHGAPYTYNFLIFINIVN